MRAMSLAFRLELVTTVFESRRERALLELVVGQYEGGCGSIELRLQALDRSHHLVRFREPSGSVLGVDQMAINVDVEHAARALDQGGRGVWGETFLQNGRQTGGPGVVVSRDAVLDLDLHWDLLATAEGPSTYAGVKVPRSEPQRRRAGDRRHRSEEGVCPVRESCPCPAVRSVQ